MPGPSRWRRRRSSLKPPSSQSHAEMRTLTGLRGGPGGAHRTQHLQRKLQPIFHGAPVFVLSDIGQRRQETRQQITMCHVQFKHVESGRGAKRRCPHKIGLHRFHLRRRHFLRHLTDAGQIRQGRGRPKGPIAAAQRVIGLLPSQLCRALASGVTELQTDARRRFRMHEFHDAPPPRRLGLVPQSGAAGRNTRIGRRAGHFSEHQPGTTRRACAVVNQMPIPGHPVDCAILGHGRDHHAIDQVHIAQTKRQKHRRARLARCRRTAMPAWPRSCR